MSKQEKTTKILVYLAVLLDVLSIGIFIPATEKLIDYYHVTPALIGVGLSVYSLCAFLAAPVLGQFSDKYGRKWPLIVCIIGTALSYLLLLTTQSYIIFLLSRIVNGITGGNFSILQAIISDISTSDEDRKKNLGLMGALFGLGFIIGPILGSVLLGQGVDAVFLGGAAFALFDALLMIGLLKETHASHNIEHKVDLFGVKTIWKYLRQKDISKYLRSMMVIGIGMFTYQSVLTIDTKLEYNIGGEQFGYILALVGLVSALNMGLFLPKFWIKMFTSRQLVTIAHIGFGTVLTALIANQIVPAGTFWLFVILISLQPIFGSLLQPVYQGEIIRLTPKTKTGEVTGVTASINTIAMIVGPLFGGVLLNAGFSIYAAGLFCVVISLVIMRKF